MIKDEALRMALEALHGFIPYLPLNDEAQCGRYDQAITAIKEALAQPEQEPVAWESLLGAVARGWCYEENANKTMDSDLAVAIAKEVQALYTTPPQRTWVGLTDEEMSEIYYHADWDTVNGWEYERLIEAKLKEKNSA